MRMTKTSNKQGFINVVYEGKTHKDLHTCLFAYFLSQVRPNKVIQALIDPSWIEAMQDELLQFKLQKVWTLVRLYHMTIVPMELIGLHEQKIKERHCNQKTKANRYAQGYTSRRRIDYERFCCSQLPRIEAIRAILKPNASFKDFVVYQMDVKSAFLFIELGKGINIIDEGISISQAKYVDEIFKKFGFSTGEKTTSTPIETSKPLLKDAKAEDVDAHLYRSMIGSLMYLIASRPDIIFQYLITSIWNALTSEVLIGGRVNGYTMKLIIHKEYLPTTEIFEQLALIVGEGSTVPVESHHTPISTPSSLQQPSSSPSKRTTRHESMVPQPRSPTHINVANEAASIGVDVKHRGAATTITSLDVGQDSGNIDKTWAVNLDLQQQRNPKTPVRAFGIVRDYGIGYDLRRHSRQVETYSDDGLDEEDATKQGRRSDKIKPMFTDKDFEELDDHMKNVKKEKVDATKTRVSTAAVTISTAEPRTPPSSITVFDDEDVTMAMAQTLIKMKEQKAKEKGVTITDVEDSSVRPVRSITTLQPLQTIDTKDKGKGVLVEEEHVKIKMRDQGDLQIQAHAELAQRLHEEELAELERR
ncbi:putative ribonuclease H-like domain-containing protein [Tanacetum coccineum]